ncbi:MAG TPA: nickel pincer cofactor biosynthesis protein LarC [Ktedonobacterales bacterium]|nr:nickel pincer cofactor biosynthesis protein LarC [Ktedonobacterales bacterium]
MLAYLDCFSGISGDMLLGALVDAGVELAALGTGLDSLSLSGYQLDVQAVVQHGMRGSQVTVTVDANTPAVERHLAEVEGIIERGQLPTRARQRALDVFRRLAMAEAVVHGIAVADVRFHEVGAVDAIVDVVGVMLGLELLGIDELYCSELPLTSGRIDSAHGELPVPAPATLELLRQTEAVWRPVRAGGELVTPTGAAIVATLAHFERPTIRIERVGHGFGRRTLPWANCLRLILGEAPATEPAVLAGLESDTVTVMEANIDDMTGEAQGWLMERLLGAGALDVSYAPLTMKKQRPGTRLTVLAYPAQHEALAEIILRESETLGVRIAELRRLKTQRRVELIETPLGPAHVKLKLIGDVVVSVSAEYTDASALATQHGLPFEEVMRRIEAVGEARFGPRWPV